MAANKVVINLATGLEDGAGLGQAAPAAVALDEPLAGGGLEQPQVLAGARLADPDRGGRGGDASQALDLDQETHARRVPQLAQSGRRSHLRYR